MDNSNPLNLTDEQMRLAKHWAKCNAEYKEVRLQMSGRTGLELPYDYGLREQERNAGLQRELAHKALLDTVPTRGDCWTIIAWAEENLTPKKGEA